MNLIALVNAAIQVFDTLLWIYWYAIKKDYISVHREIDCTSAGMSSLTRFYSTRLCLKLMRLK